MTAAEDSVISTERERRQWFVALALGVVDETLAALPAPPVPVAGDVIP
jgi:hypothetical protein